MDGCGTILYLLWFGNCEFPNVVHFAKERWILLDKVDEVSKLVKFLVLEFGYPKPEFGSVSLNFEVQVFEFSLPFSCFVEGFEGKIEVAFGLANQEGAIRVD